MYFVCYLFRNYYFAVKIYLTSTLGVLSNQNVWRAKNDGRSPGLRCCANSAGAYLNNYFVGSGLKIIYYATTSSHVCLVYFKC